MRWEAAEEALIASGGGVRALLPIEVREMETVRRAGALQLRRRDDGSNWQPVVDGLLDLSLEAVGESKGAKLTVNFGFYAWLKALLGK